MDRYRYYMTPHLWSHITCYHWLRYDRKPRWRRYYLSCKWIYQPKCYWYGTQSMRYHEDSSRQDAHYSILRSLDTPSRWRYGRITGYRISPERYDYRFSPPRKWIPLVTYPYRNRIIQRRDTWDHRLSPRDEYISHLYRQYSRSSLLGIYRLDDSANSVSLWYRGRDHRYHDEHWCSHRMS